MARKKLKKEKCEICGESNKKILHLHHLIERTEINCSNDPQNLIILCPSCHSKTHSKDIEIIGVFPSTELPNGRSVLYKINGKFNIEGLEEPYLETIPSAMRITRRI